MAIARKLNRTLTSFIKRQPLFFVATAAPQGRVNLSPKGPDCLRVLDDERIVWITSAAAAMRPRPTCAKAPG
jgi:predicted pyridoxine 5'-phosphate oxidase superfamily flavin-nucleotide-binding protein